MPHRQVRFARVLILTNPVANLVPTIPARYCTT